MPRTTNNYDRKIDFIGAIADLAEPFNSTLLDTYPEYRRDISAYLNDEKESFISILNKVGQDGCEVLYDRVVNFIDDVSNIDTSAPSALLSQASAVNFPYKDKKTVEQLDILTRTSPLLQNIIWAASTSFRNSKIIFNRLGILEDSELSSTEISSTDSLNDVVHEKIVGLLKGILTKRYLYLDENDKVASDITPRIIDFSWVANSIFYDKIIKDKSCSSGFVIDFGNNHMLTTSLRPVVRIQL